MKTKARIQPNNTTMPAHLTCRAGAIAPSRALSTWRDETWDREEEHPSCLVLFDREAGAVVNKIPLTSAESYRLFELGVKTEFGISEFVAEQLRRSINREDCGAAEKELGKAVQDARFLMTVLIDKIRGLLPKGTAGDRDGDVVDTLAGLTESIQSRLAVALDRCHPEPSEAPPLTSRS